MILKFKYGVHLVPVLAGRAGVTHQRDKAFLQRSWKPRADYNKVKWLKKIQSPTSPEIFVLFSK